MDQLLEVVEAKPFPRWVLDAQAAEIPLGIDGDDGQKILAVKDILVRSYFSYRIISRLHIKCRSCDHRIPTKPAQIVDGRDNEYEVSLKSVLSKSGLEQGIELNDVVTILERSDLGVESSSAESLGRVSYPGNTVRWLYWCLFRRLSSTVLLNSRKEFQLLGSRCRDGK